MNQSKDELNYYQDDISSTEGSDVISEGTAEEISEDVQDLLNQYLGVSEDLQDLILDYLELKNRRRKKRSKTDNHR